MTRQLSFDLPSVAALGREDFFVSPANAVAVAMIDAWQTWAGRKLALIGPEGSGKTHLVHVWAEAAGAQITAASDLAGADIPALAHGHIAIEDIHEIAGNAGAEEALFHLHNLVLAEGHSLLVTADRPAQQWGLSLPDLASRMQGTPAAILERPDDRLLAALVMKLFADRQLSPSPKTISYLATHMDRSFAAARQIVAEIDAAALAENRPITRGLAARILSETGLSSPPASSPDAGTASDSSPNTDPDEAD
ncbi:chromosomal replication initiator DnaA [Rhodobacterales bacterium 59_46_T64]|nr:chromosomal replication initiator DnaA [Rhodobacterales bacterium 59_46_T64]